ncbi:hypothetical protein NIES593_01420 [Hydrococcus rivularis NIES-593]|uniref:Uncharacterized protein n=1 Tax=Hydrococcus rivularis NIES-593 TaxID=1921803 RepID=A0A1U7HT31_9CYAN|nr:hypothetical protein [Hydrococcus rivularis]OKH26737.1 hypothetical protein NIES593_01420 [Hydrococcus rivularis NIES-593]
MILPFGRLLEGELVAVSAAERIESCKAGGLGAIAFAFAYFIAALVNSLVLAVRVESLAQLQVSVGVELAVKVAIALLSGFLFGVTYRYIIRNDGNSHLKDGAVLAFGLVRGLASIETSDYLVLGVWLPTALGVESVFCFAIARLVLDLALSCGWIEPFH